ncbi:MAG TPA: hypothetical protein VMH41_17010 [Mycobacteriales bacterium]|nr:hypothetical protein [Mycobacteriales bacterium]
MVRRDWTYTQVREYLDTPSGVMRWRNVIYAVMREAAEGTIRPEPEPTGWAD